jgi:RNA ligase (TIGR02306 family)
MSIIKQYMDEQSDLKNVTVLGEVFGCGVQDLQYNQKTPTFRVFDVMVDDEYLSSNDKIEFCKKLNLEMVPLLFVGPYSNDIIEKYRDGKDNISNTNIREGIVIRSTNNRKDVSLGRVMLKAVSPNYLLRKGDVTEYT